MAATGERAGRPIKVLELIARLNIGGPAVLVVELAAGLPEDRFEVELAAGRVGPGEAQMDFWANARNVAWTQVDGLSPELGRGNLTAFKEIVGLIKKRRPDVIHTHTAKAGTLGRLAARWIRGKKPKIVHTFHGHVFEGYFPRWKTRLFLAVERFLAGRADRIIVLSPEQAEDICRVYRVCDREKVTIIPVGLDLDLFERAEAKGFRGKLGISPDVFLVGQVGRLTGIKDPATSIESFKRLAELTERPAVLVFVGAGELEAELRAQAAGSGLADRVVFAGWQEDMPAVYAELDALVLTSINEGLPLALIEAMAAGKPVAATPVGGVPGLLGLEESGRAGDYVVGRRGLGFSRGDAGGLAKALAWLMAGGEEVDRMARAAQEFVLANYSRQAFLEAHARLYQELVDSER